MIASQEERKRGERADHDRIAKLEGELERVGDRQSLVGMGLTPSSAVVSNLVAGLWARR